jgi:hypothetical protein
LATRLVKSNPRALPRPRRDKKRHASQGSQANSNGANGGEEVLALSGGLADTGDCEAQPITGDSCRCGVDQPNQESDQRRADSGKGNLAEHQDRYADEEADNERPDEARATAKGSQACTQSSEKGSA